MSRVALEHRVHSIPHVRVRAPTITISPKELRMTAHARCLHRRLLFSVFKESVHVTTVDLINAV